MGVRELQVGPLLLTGVDGCCEKHGTITVLDLKTHDPFPENS